MEDLQTRKMKGLKRGHQGQELDFEYGQNDGSHPEGGAHGEHDLQTPDVHDTSSESSVALARDAVLVPHNKRQRLS